MGPELRQVVQTIMSDLGMGEDQSKIDALEQYLEENLSTFFSEDSYMSSVIKMGAEKSFTSHSARIKEFLTRGIGGGTIMEGAGPTGASPAPDISIGELSPFQKEHLSKEETETIYTARAILEGLMKRERDASFWSVYRIASILAGSISRIFPSNSENPSFVCAIFVMVSHRSVVL